MTATPATTRMFSESEYNAQVAKIRILEGKVRRRSAIAIDISNIL